MLQNISKQDSGITNNSERTLIVNHDHGNLNITITPITNISTIKN